MAKDFTPSSRNREAFEAMTDTVGNVPPQAVELEEAVLGALMLEKDCIITVQEFVSPEAFYTEEHRLIYKAIPGLSITMSTPRLMMSEPPGRICRTNCEKASFTASCVP